MKMVIVGGDAAGMSAAMQIVRNSEEHEIIALERGGIYSYGQCGLPYVISGDVDSTDDLIARTPETFREKYGIDARVFHEVKKIACDDQVVFGVNHRTGEEFEESYDRLLIATGADPVIPSWEGRDLHGVYSLKTIPDLHEIRDDLTPNVEHITVIGGGYIGLEMAESFAAIGKSVRIIDRGSQVAKIFDADMGESIHHEAKRQGVELILNETVEMFKGTERVESVVTDQRGYKTDLVLVATGVSPNTGFIEETAIDKDDNGAINVNASMKTNVKHIYAAGDCATQYHRIKKRDDYIPLGTHANKQGRVAGLNMVGKRKAFQGVVGTSILKFFDLTLGRTGLSAQEAKQEQIPFQSVTIQSTNAAGYYSKEDPLTLKLVYNERSRQLLGGQIIGKQGTDKRIDVLATALYNQMTVDDLIDLDLAYAPPYNSVWDPVQQAARRSK